MTAAPNDWLTAETLDKWEDWTREKLKTAKRRDVDKLENDLRLLTMARAALDQQAALETATELLDEVLEVYDVKLRSTCPHVGYWKPVVARIRSYRGKR